MLERGGFDELLRKAKHLGVRPISGGSGDPDPDPEPDPEPTPDPEPDPEPDPQPEPDEASRLREENARLRGELDGLKAQPRPETKNATKTVADIEAEIEAAYAAGQITDFQRIQRHAALVADVRDQERAKRDALERPVRNAETKLAAYVEKYPDLNVVGSELHGKVMRELRGVVEDFGFPREDPRAQVLAVERVVGGHRLGGGMDGKEITRRKTPTGGTGGGGQGGDGDGTRKPDPLKDVERLYPDQVAYWDRMGMSREDRAAEAPLVLARRGARRRSA